MPRKYYDTLEEARTVAANLAAGGYVAAQQIDENTFEDPDDHWTYEAVQDDARWSVLIRDEDGNRLGSWGEMHCDGIGVHEESTDTEHD
jgi:hypothetical protein